MKGKEIAGSWILLIFDIIGRLRLSVFLNRKMK
jgi:hypothetical protein